MVMCMATKNRKSEVALWLTKGRISMDGVPEPFCLQLREDGMADDEATEWFLNRADLEKLVTEGRRLLNETATAATVEPPSG